MPRFIGKSLFRLQFRSFENVFLGERFVGYYNTSKAKKYLEAETKVVARVAEITQKKFGLNLFEKRLHLLLCKVSPRFSEIFVGKEKSRGVKYNIHLERDNIIGFVWLFDDVLLPPYQSYAFGVYWMVS